MKNCYTVRAVFLSPAGGGILQIDYFTLYGESSNATEESSWGAIKNLFRE